MAAPEGGNRLMPTVSIIIPTYNRVRDVQTAIRSLLAQTRVPDEIIVVDDGSADDTASIVARFDPPVRLIRHERSLGPSAARNTGLHASSGDLIGFLDSDDTLPPNSLERRVSALTAAPDYDAVYGDCWMIGRHGERIGLFSQLQPRPHPSGDLFPALAVQNLAPVHTFLFRRACWEQSGDFDITLRQLEDHEFWLRMSTCCQFLYLDTPLANYHQHDSMISVTRADAMRQSRITVQRRAIDHPRFATLTPAEQSRIHTRYARNLAAVEGQITEARRWLRRAIRLRPSNLEAIAIYTLTLTGKRGMRALSHLRRVARARFEKR
jgi:glycosyltransferase involved in cell wall biosynthesis